MKKETFWTDAARAGAVIGLVLSASYLVENWMTLSGSMTLWVLQSLVSLAVAGVHYYLLHRYTRQRERLYAAEDGFTFMQGYSFIQIMSILSGLIVGCTNFIYIHLIVGYDNYITLTTKALAEMVRVSGQSALAQPINQMIAGLQQAEAPGLIDTLFGGMTSGWLFGAVFGLIIAGVISRKPNLFGTKNTTSDDE